MTTIKDVADLAQVSIATVSRVLNNSHPVSPELDARVRRAVETLHYEQNTVARNFRRSESLTLGVIIPDSSNPFFAEITHGAEAVCFAHGYTLVLCNTDEDPRKAAHHLRSLAQQRVAGLMLVSPGQIEGELAKFLQKPYPLVIVDRSLQHVQADTVISDNEAGARAAMEHLLALGHTRIGFISGDPQLETVQLRWHGAKAALAAAGVSLDPALIYYTHEADETTDQPDNQPDDQPQAGFRGAAHLLGLPTPPTALFAFNDLMAFGALSCAHGRGLHIPRDLSVIGFDDISLASFAVPPLTTIAQPKAELGRQAAEMLIRRLHGAAGAPERAILPTRLMVRASTAVPRGASA